MAKIYVSSTRIDLIDYRREVLRTLRLMQQDVIAMEDYTATGERPLKKCLADVAQCEFYIGIFAFRYGFIAPTDNPEQKSITELEYRCARANGKECLIFLADEEMAWPVRYIDRDEMPVKKLRDLRQELQLEHMVAWFKNEIDLADQVSKALYAKLKSPSTPKPASLDPFHAKLCNRHHQVRQFRDFFDDNLEKRRGRPQVYFVHGEDGECHDSLIDRLVGTHIKSTAVEIWGPQQGIVTAKSIGWAFDGKLEERLRDLQRMLFDEFDPRYRKSDWSTTALSKLPLAAPNRIITFAHSLPAARVDDVAWELIEDYLTYWADLASDDTTPQFAIFLCLVYPRPQPASWYKPWTLSRRFDKPAFTARLGQISARRHAQLPCLALDELPPVGSEEVKLWFKKYGRDGGFTMKTELDSLARLFADDDARQSMIQIELELLRLVETA